MRPSTVRCCILALSLFALPAWAGVGSQSSGVTTTDPTNPSQEVQDQSANFVAQNQLAQNAATNGIAVPGAGTSMAGSRAIGANAQHDSNDVNASAGGAPESSTQAEPESRTEPEPPPPPPPTYVSHIRPVNRTEPPDSDTDTPIARTDAPARATAPVAPPRPEAHPPRAERKPLPTPAKPVQQPKAADDPLLVAPTGPTGGRGAAPEGYTFYFGLLIAAALLALAFVCYLRLARGTASR